MITVNEKSDHTFTVSFTDAAGDAMTPASVRYRIDDETSRKQLIDWTGVPSPSPEMEIAIAGAHHTMINTAARYERKVFTVEATDGAGRKELTQLTYRVKNLDFV